MAWRPRLAHAAAAPAFSAAWAGGNVRSQSAAMNRRPVTPSDSGEASHSRGGTMTSGWISEARFTTDWAGTIRVFTGPPGTSTLAVTPVPARSSAMIATWASLAALEGPYGANPRRIIVSRLVVTLMMRPHFCTSMGTTAARATRN